MYTYEIVTGKLTDADGALMGYGWSGRGTGRNNPDMVADGMTNDYHTQTNDTADIGPLPPGLYTIEPAVNHPRLGPIALKLIPDPSDQEYGRGGFYIHGASIANPAASSEGCIIQPRYSRLAIDERLKSDNRLQVVKKLEV